METEYGNLGGWANRHCLLARFPGNRQTPLSLNSNSAIACWSLTHTLVPKWYSVDHLKVGPTAGRAPSHRLSSFWEAQLDGFN